MTSVTCGSSRSGCSSCGACAAPAIGANVLCANASASARPDARTDDPIARVTGAPTRAGRRPRRRVS